MATAVLPMPVGPVITISVFSFIVFLGEVNESTGQRVNEFGSDKSDKSDRSDRSDGNTIISKAKDYRLNFFNFLTP